MTSLRGQHPFVCISSGTFLLKLTWYTLWSFLIYIYFQGVSSFLCLQITVLLEVQFSDLRLRRRKEEVPSFISLGLMGIITSVMFSPSQDLSRFFFDLCVTHSFPALRGKVMFEVDSFKLDNNHKNESQLNEISFLIHPIGLDQQYFILKDC